jgi:hypothetical protein
MSDGIYPHAELRLLPPGLNHWPGGNEPRLAIVHHMQGSLESADQWFHDPVSLVSSQFGVGLDGEVVQWVNCNDTAWHAASANPKSIGIEEAGYSGEPLTSLQLDSTALLLRWAFEQYPAVAPWLTTRPDTGSGLAWHGLGGVAWGGHPDCPGLPVVHQLPGLLKAAGR